MKKLFLLMIVLLASMFLLCSCECKHKELSEADCITPQKCLKCNASIGEALGHTDGEWIIDQEPSCTEDGSKHQICSVCNATIKTEILTKLGHIDGDWITDEEPTCTEDGSKHQICSVCNVTIKTETLTKLGHTNGAWITDKEASCTEDGSKHQICSVCNVTIKTEALKKLGHTNGAWITDKEASCTEDGSKRQICSVCNVTIKTEALKKLGHTNGAWITDKEASCTEDGSKHQICSVCNATIKTEPISALGHNYSEIVTKKTCTTAAKVTYNCSVCNDTYEENVPEINISIEYIGTSSSIINGYGYYSKGYKINILGGYGNIQATLELYTSESATLPASTLNVTYREIDYTLNYQGYSDNSDAFWTRMIITDDAGNKIEYKISHRDSSIIEKTTIKGECAKLTAENDITYINTYGFGKYTCDQCGDFYYKDRDGKILEVADLKLSSDGTAVMSCSNANTAEILIIPDSVTMFADEGMFTWRNNLHYVLFNENPIELDLYGSPIKHIYIPANVTVNMYYTSSLTTVIWGNGVTEIDQYGIYNGCMGRYLGDSSIENIVIPKSVTLIKYDVFDSTTNLSTVFYMGTEEDWNAIDIEKDGNLYLIEATRYYYSENQPTAEGNYWHFVNGIPTIW